MNEVMGLPHAVCLYMVCDVLLIECATNNSTVENF